MTFYNQLQMGMKPSDFTAGEALAGLWFEVTTATDFLLFVLTLLVFLSVVFAQSFPVVLSCVTALVAWEFVVRRLRKTTIFSLAVSVGFWAVFMTLFVIYGSDNNVFLRVVSLGCVINRLGFHPLLRLFIHVPFSSPAVQTGLGLGLIAIGSFLSLEPEEEGIRLLFFVLCGSLAVITAALMAETSVIQYRAQNKNNLYLIFSPWKDVWLSIKTVSGFPLSTGLGVSALASLLQAEDEEEVLTRRLLEDWLEEERGCQVWTFLLEWKQTRLGKPATEDELSFLRIQETIRVNDSPLRSPLMRGHV